MPADLTRRLERLLETGIRATDPGAAIGVYRDGELMSSAAVGMARLDLAEPMRTDTVMDIASVSKQMTAATVLLLARDGQVRLEDEVRELLTEVRAGVTLQHCLQHTSGLPDYLAFADLAGESIGRACAREHFEAGLAELCRTVQFEPGSAIRYSNTGYVLAALVAERVSGTRWDQLMDERVFAPLGMSGSRVAIASGSPGPGAAFGYTRGTDGTFDVCQLGEDEVPPGTLQVVGDGEVRTTIQELSAWHGFLADGRVLGADIRQQLLSPARLVDGRTTSYGMGLWWHQLGGITAFGHSGSIWGFRAYSITDSASGVGACALSNQSGVDAGDLAWRALREGLDEHRMSGLWSSVEQPQVLEISIGADGGLAVRGDGEHRLSRSEDGVWAGAGFLREIVRDGDGLVIRDNLGEVTRFRTLDASWPIPVPLVAGRYRCEHPEIELEVTESQGEFRIRVGHGSAEHLSFLGRVAETYVFQAGTRTVVLGSETSGQLLVGDGTLRLRFDRAPE